jgi:hypothetical protein
MLESLIQLWFILLVAAGIGWWRARTESGRARAARLLRNLLGLGLVGALWAWLDTLPFHGWPAKITLLAGAVWGTWWYVRMRLWPAWEIWWKQFLMPAKWQYEEDPRDVQRLRWHRVRYSRSEALAPYLRPDKDPYWVGRSDPVEVRVPLVPGLRWPRIARRTVCDVAIPSKLLRRHVLVVGATRTGKTVGVALPVMEQQIRRGLGLLFLTFKHDPPAFSYLLDTAKRAGRERDVVYLSLRPDDHDATGYWNPLEWRDHAVVAEAIVWAAISDRPELRYYSAQNVDALSVVLEAARRQGEVLDFRGLGELLSEAGMTGMGTALGEYLKPFPDLKARAKTVRWEHASDIKMLAARLAQFPACVPSPARARLDLAEAIRDGKIVLCDLYALTLPQAAAYIARMMVVLFGAALSHLRRTEEDPTFLVVLDEFATVAGPHLQNLISKAGGFGIAMLLATQTVADVRAAGEREGVRALPEQIVENVGTKVVLTVSSEAEARWWSGASGTVLRSFRFESVLEEGAAMEGLGTVRAAEKESPAVHPNKLLHLPFGKAYAWLPSRRCLLLPGGKPIPGDGLDVRETVLVNLSYPDASPAWPELRGGRLPADGEDEAPVVEAGPSESGQPAPEQAPPAGQGTGGSAGALGTWDGSRKKRRRGKRGGRKVRERERLRELERVLGGVDPSRPAVEGDLEDDAGGAADDGVD